MCSVQHAWHKAILHQFMIQPNSRSSTSHPKILSGRKVGSSHPQRDLGSWGHARKVSIFHTITVVSQASQAVLVVKSLPPSAAEVRDAGSVLVRKIPRRRAQASHSSVLAWKIPWTEEPGGLQSMRSPRVRHDQSDLAHTHYS